MAVETLLCILNNMPRRREGGRREGGREGGEREGGREERGREGGREGGRGRGRVIEQEALVLVLCAYHMW